MFGSRVRGSLVGGVAELYRTRVARGSPLSATCRMALIARKEIGTFSRLVVLKGALFSLLFSTGFLPRARVLKRRRV